MKNKKGMLIVSIIIVILISIAFTSRAFQNDTFYTIKIGQSILKHGIDMKDHFSWHVLPYTYPHWLYDVLTYKVYQAGGFQGLYLLTIMIFMVTGVSFYLVNVKRNKSYFISLLFSIMGTIMIARYAVARAQLVTYFLFLIEIYCIEEFLSSGKKRYGIILVLISLLIANLHCAVWPMYFVLMLPYIAEYIMSFIHDKIKNKPKIEIFQDRLILEKNKNIKYLLLIIVIGLLMGFATPIGFTPYTYFIKTVMGNSLSYIEEHQPLILVNNLFVIGYLVILLVTLIFTKVKIRLCDFFMILGLIIMAFLSRRHVALLGIIGMFFLCRLICSIGFIRGKKELDFDLPGIGLFVVLVTIVITSSVVYSVNSKEDYINQNLYPVKMVDWMKDHLEMKDVKLYNEYDFGSYLIYRNIPVYIDSRSDLYTKPFNEKKDILDECMKITEHYGRVFKRDEITHILIYKDTYLNQILAASPNYKLIHKDGNFVLYEYIVNNETEEEV